jgi:hypothetical protein
VKLSSDQTYQVVVQGIQKMYDNTLSEPEAHEAARNVIGVCGLILEYQKEKAKNNLINKDVDF